ncbi:Kre28p SCDLUD_003822 [Saccharomycodes ludwigii]|uniref:Kre28p n=1 Tax=Saccharomycodes ludwigii TaxID=36035 RepID=UPI001E843621|nr:hypothetical protein SCDLUD_003822 [Saccharomycodes ludwigii]KAH3899545.1 hypothetical protein SCDLUD_003822 [Saccharomycodes ludwigii]
MSIPYTNNNKAQEDLKRLENEITKITESVLSKQEAHRSEAFKEFNSILTATINNHEKKLIKIEPSCVPNIIEEYVKIVNDLKQEYMKQELLEIFITSLLSPESYYNEQDNNMVLAIPNIIELEKKIQVLNKYGIQEKLIKIDNLRNDKLTTIITDLDKRNGCVLDTCLNVTNVIEECWLLLNELDKCRDTYSSNIDESVTNSDDLYLDLEDMIKDL